VPNHQGFRNTSNINRRLYGQFVAAVGKRYSGRYPAANLNGKIAPMPKIDYWGIYNEPNIGGWTTPQWRKVHGRFVEASPAIYRRMDPLVFIRALYCLGARYAPLHGAAATRIGCPAHARRRAFVAAHPALFLATGWAHHPYDFTKAPSYRRHDPNAATLSGIAHLETALARPPDPGLRPVSAHRRRPQHRLSRGIQALLGDLPERAAVTPVRQPEARLPRLRVPLWLPRPRHGHHVAVWAQIRPAPHTGTLQFQRRGSGKWTVVAHFAPTDAEGFVSTSVSLPSAGSVRLGWDHPGALAPVYGRTATVR